MFFSLPYAIFVLKLHIFDNFNLIRMDDHPISILFMNGLMIIFIITFIEALILNLFFIILTFILFVYIKM
jgi:hypothetical protein